MLCRKGTHTHGRGHHLGVGGSTYYVVAHHLSMTMNHGVAQQVWCSMVLHGSYPGLAYDTRMGRWTNHAVLLPLWPHPDVLCNNGFRLPATVAPEV